MQQLLINCPKCHQDFDLLEIGKVQNRDTESFLEYKKHLEEEIRGQIEKDISQNLEKNFNFRLESKIKEIDLEKNIELSKLNTIIENLKKDMAYIEENKQKESQMLATQLESKITQEKQSEIDSLKEKIVKLESDAKNIDQLNKSELEKRQLELTSNFEIEKRKFELDLSKYSSQLENYKNEKQLELNQKELELKEKYESIISTKEIEITDLKIANATNRILNNKTKGENWENEVELELRKIASSTGDEVNKITRTGTKADFLQIVRDKDKDLGKIVFECKNGEWKETWEPKLTEDMAKEGANYAILVATSTHEKFKVPFLVSQKNKNILIADPDSFVFVTSMVRKLILIESNLRDKTDNNETFEQFNKWKLNSLETFKGIVQKAVDGIESDERTILNKVEDIKKHREKLWRNWQTLMLDFLEGFRY
ncbi:DUF2130 domain-containing protein [Spiroplasma floricola]|uniref:DUF2130 domain-containing protein n=1 Tax=Spiroplasma floricola 23-6 TaxID=1336749 RepID=A0A2K8SEC1_9MOLU|nr:DUF2130 domain-containing protein [Spiroplasma floricola]AUB31772.1 hypothetical protein SFLOR_v1c07240 [Spiroplasma floricola 23-6]